MKDGVEYFQACKAVDKTGRKVSRTKSTTCKVLFDDFRKRDILTILAESDSFR